MNHPESYISNVENLILLPKELLPFVSSYKLNIVEIPKLTEKETGRFRTDLRQVMDLLRCRRDPEKLEKLLMGNEAYRLVATDAYQLMNQYANLERYGVFAENTQGGGIDMKDGLDGIVEKYQKIGEKNGERKGEKRGKKAERENGIRIFILDKLEDQVEPAIIKERLMKRYTLNEANATKYLKKYAGEISAKRS